MIISIVYHGGSGIDHNVTGYETQGDTLKVEYDDGTIAYYPDGQVVKAWDNEDVYEEE